MQKDWEINWEDYYEILQVHPSAELEVIQAAYRKLVQKYHPDINKDPAAGERMKKINIAYEALSDPEKRRQYDSEWFRKGNMTGKSALPKPKPVVDPEYISFKDVEPGKTQTASFVIRNTGGPYAKMFVPNPNSWVKIVRGFSLTDSDELPVQVEIEATGENWDKTYSEIIRVRLDEAETQVRVELQTKPAPVREKAKVRARSSTRSTHSPPASPPASPKHGMPAWGKWFIGLAVMGLIVILIGQFWSSDNSPNTTPTASEIRRQRIEESLKSWRQNNMPSGASRYDYSFSFDEAWVWALIGVYDPQHPELGRILYSGDNGNNWEIKWEKERTSIQRVLALNKSEVIVFIDRQIFIKTSDGGTTWNESLTLRNIGSPSDALLVINRGETIAFGIVPNGTNETNVSIRTNDGGKTWEEIISHSRYYGSVTGVLRTYDGGKTWQEIDIRYK